MEKIIMQKTFNFGKIAYENPERRLNAVTVNAELRRCGGEPTFIIDRTTGEHTSTGTTPKYIELSICGEVWNRFHTDFLCGGQCLDTIAEYREQLDDVDTFDVLYSLWKEWHLNGMNAGTPEQETAVKAWEAEGNVYDYSAVCDMLKEKGLYEVNFTGISVGRRYNNEPYKYGTGWIVREIPGNVLIQIEHLLST